MSLTWPDARSVIGVALGELRSVPVHLRQREQLGGESSRRLLRVVDSELDRPRHVKAGVGLVEGDAAARVEDMTLGLKGPERPALMTRG